MSLEHLIQENTKAIIALTETLQKLTEPEGSDSLMDEGTLKRILIQPFVKQSDTLLEDLALEKDQASMKAKEEMCVSSKPITLPSKQPSFDEAAAACVQLAKICGTDKAIQVLAEFKVTRVSGMCEGDYISFIERCSIVMEDAGVSV